MWLKLMQWVYQYPKFVILLKICYATWLLQIIIVPLILALLKKSKEINTFFISVLISFVFAGVIYYFFPTIAPAGVMESPYFLSNQHSLVTRFYEIHQHLPISVFDGGYVAFPSCHTMQTLLVLVACRKIKTMFYPLLIINALLIFATLGLGYHYLVDVLAAFVIVGITMGLTNSLTTKKSL